MSGARRSWFPIQVMRGRVTWASRASSGWSVASPFRTRPSTQTADAINLEIRRTRPTRATLGAGGPPGPRSNLALSRNARRGQTATPRRDARTYPNASWSDQSRVGAGGDQHLVDLRQPAGRTSVAPCSRRDPGALREQGSTCRIAPEWERGT